MEVYRIFNKINGKSYVGVTKWDFKTRYPQGRWDKWTHSVHLLATVERIGVESFDWEVLWKGNCSEEELYKLEKLYISQYNCLVPKGYNLRAGGDIKGPPKNIKEYELIDFDGNVYQVKNLSRFCKKRKLNYSAMLNMVSGRNTSSQGFALSSTSLEKVLNPKECWVVENIKNGELEIVYRGEIHSWARSKGLNPRKIESMIFGKSFKSQGWKLQLTDLTDHVPKRKNTKFIGPDGKIVIIESIYQFCKERGWDRSGFYKLINNKQKTYKGFKIYEG